MRELSSSAITNDALLQLRSAGHRVRRVNNIPHNKRYRYQVQKGCADIEGFSTKGVHIECEVKKIGDTLKPAQKERLLDLKNCGGIAIVATQVNSSTHLFEIGEYLNLKRLK